MSIHADDYFSTRRSNCNIQSGGGNALWIVDQADARIARREPSNYFPSPIVTQPIRNHYFHSAGRFYLPKDTLQARLDMPTFIAARNDDAYVWR